MSAAIETHELGRTYRSRTKAPDIVALEGLSMAVDEGEVHGLLGPNGAGKTTLVKILSTVLLPTAGSAAVLGHDVVRATAAVRERIGIVFGGERGLYWRLTGRENLEYWAALYHVPGAVARTRITELLERVGLADRADYLVETYSRGMKQRLHLARGLVADARVLFLDEPTTGMDPIAAREFRQLVLDLRAQGRTILLTTHDMAEAEAVCDRVALIEQGRLIAVETPASLGRLVAQFERVDFEGGSPALLEGLGSMPEVETVRALAEGSYRIELRDGDSVGIVLSALVGAGVTSLRTSRPSLEEVYIHLIGARGMSLNRVGSDPLA